MLSCGGNFNDEGFGKELLDVLSVFGLGLCNLILYLVLEAYFLPADYDMRNKYISVRNNICFTRIFLASYLLR